MWKQTSDELPKYGQNVILAVVDEESGRRYAAYGNRYCTDAVGERYKRAGSTDKIHDEVYAWMPLPDLPESN